MLCGKSGCGKTTLTRLLNGLAPSFFDGKLDGMCQSFGLCAGEAAIEEYVPIVGSVFQNPKTQHFNIDTTAELAFPCDSNYPAVKNKKLHLQRLVCYSQSYWSLMSRPVTWITKQYRNYMI